MIPQADIIHWRNDHPWQLDNQVEQDLVLSRMLVELYQDEHIRKNLAFRGGTAIHKLYLTPSARYSEDIDLVQIVPGRIGATLDRIHAVLDSWLGKPEYVTTRMASNLFYHFEPESNAALQLKVKIEINTREHSAKHPMVTTPFNVDSRWFEGKCKITTYSIEELLGTKLRALFQRSKGRDLFDIDYVLRQGNPDCTKIVEAFVHYVAEQNRKITARQFRKNLEEKKKDRNFGTDVVPLLREGINFLPADAFQRVEDSLISLLDSAWRDIKLT